MKYGFIGFGNLAKAIYEGSKENKEINFAYIDKTNNFKKPKKLKDMKELVFFSDVIWLCIKPQNLSEVLEDLKKINLTGKIIVSPVAGKSISFIENSLGKNIPIIRIMPNLAIAYGKSVTAYCTNNRKNLLKEKVKKNLSKLGKTVELPEKSFDLFTAIFGSGPAFILEILKVFEDKINELKIKEIESIDLLLELTFGTLVYLKENKDQKSISKLIEKVTSKGGTTEAGLKSFKENNLNELLENIIVSAQKRSKEISV